MRFFFEGDALYEALMAARMLNTDGTPDNDIREIWVSRGDYTIYSATRDASFRLVPYAHVYGGFPAGGSVQKAARDAKLNETIMRGVLRYQPDVRVWNVVRGERYAAIDGFTIKEGLADDMSNPNELRRYCGAGMYNEGVHNLVVKNCVFENNQARATDLPPGFQCNGGGMFNLNSTVTIERCGFDGNIAADYGGGLCIIGGYGELPPIVKCDFSNNICANYGAAAYISSRAPNFVRCTFIRNGYAAVGGGVYVRAGDAIVSHCTFTLNHAQYFGGAVASDPVGLFGMTIEKSILWRDSLWYTPAMKNYAEIYCAGFEQVLNSNVWMLDPNATYPSPEPQYANINRDPLFRVLKPQKALDLRLSYTPAKSPCIDHPNMPADMRYPGNKPDMGAYEHATLMPLGNSITEGYKSEISGGYRKYLWDLFPAEFVGQFGGNPGPFDTDHCGKSGAPIGGYPPLPSTIRYNFDQYLAMGKEFPDIVLITGGANNIRDKNANYLFGTRNPSNQSHSHIDEYIGNALRELDGLIRHIQAAAQTRGKSVKIFVASVPNFTEASWLISNLAFAGHSELSLSKGSFAEQYNYVTIVPGVTHAQNGGVDGMLLMDGVNVSFVDINRYVNPVEILKNDGVHPTAAGYRRMAEAWFAAFPWGR